MSGDCAKFKHQFGYKILDQENEIDNYITASFYIY